MTANTVAQPLAAAGGFAEPHFVALAGRSNEPDWLRTRRDAAWQRLQGMGPLALPTDKGQKSLPALDPGQLSLPDAASRGISTSPGLTTIDWGGVSGNHQVVDGVDGPLTLGEEWARQGVILTDLATAAREHPDLVRQYLVDVNPDKERLQLTALHEAFRTGGRFLYVPKNVDVTLPVSFAYGITRSGLALFPYTLIVADQGSRLTIVEDVSSAGFEGLALFNALTDIHVKAGAQVFHYHLEHWGRNVFHFLQQRAWLDRDASFTTFAALNGGRQTYTYNETNLRGAGSNGVVLGVVYGEADQSFLSRTVQNHVGPHTTSDLVVKAVLKDKAHSDYSGWITIEKDAVKTEAQQTQRNLLLSEEARADSIPNLEILTNDVRCAHGAAVGPVDEEHIYYLRSRGLQPAEAERMVVQGFVEDVVLRIKQPQMLRRVQAALRDRLGFTGEDLE